MNPFPGFIAIFIFFLSFQARAMNSPRENAYKWWFHPTCYESQDSSNGVLRSGLQPALEEVKKTVERTINRMTEIMQRGTSRAADDINNDIFKLRFKSN